MKVSRNQLIFGLFAFTMLLPSYFSNSIFNMIENVAFLLMILILLKYRYIPNKIVFMIAVYFVFLTISSFVNDTTTADIHLIVSSLKTVTFIAAIDWYLTKNTKQVIDVLWIWSLLFGVLNFVSVVLYPKGLYTVEYVLNEWGATAVNYRWILGSKNSQAMLYVLLIILTYFRFEMYKERQRFKSLFWNIFVISISIYTIVGVKSSTSIVVVLITVCAIIYNAFTRKTFQIKFNSTWILIGYIILTFMILMGNTAFLQPIISGVFGKDITFNSRTLVWKRTGVLILQKPILGWGMLGDAMSQDLLGSFSFTSAHNQILNSMLQGGIILFLVLVMIFVIIANRINQESTRKMQIIEMSVLISILIQMLFEAVLGEISAWIVMYLCFGLVEKVYKSENTRLHVYENTNLQKILSVEEYM